jgi:hypothetical protein
MTFVTPVHTFTMDTIIGNHNLTICIESFEKSIILASQSSWWFVQIRFFTESYYFDFSSSFVALWGGCLN